MPLRAAGALVATLALVAPGSPAVAKTTPKPSIKVSGISVNRAYATRGTAIKAGDSANGCYIIGGASGEPQRLEAYVYVHAVKVPANAKMTYTFHTPWDKEEPTTVDFSGTFGGSMGGLFRAFGKQQAEIFGGPTSKQDHVTYRMLPTGGTPASSFINGTYSFRVTVRFAGRTLTSEATVTVAC